METNPQKLQRLQLHDYKDYSLLNKSKLNDLYDDKQKVIGFKLSTISNVNPTIPTIKEKRICTTTKLPIMIRNKSKINSFKNKNIKNGIQGDSERETDTISNERIVCKQSMISSRINIPDTDLDSLSTSPESILDNVLSAASSLSIQSDSVSNLDVVSDFSNINTSKAITTAITSGMEHRKETKILFENSIKRNDSEIFSLKNANSISPSPKYMGIRNYSTMPLKPTNAFCKSFETTRNRSSPISSIAEKMICDTNNKSTESNTASKRESLHMPVEEEFKCSICDQIYTDPRILNCLHTFCLQCLMDEYSKQDVSKLQVEQLINSDSKYIDKARSDVEDRTSRPVSMKAMYQSLDMPATTTVAATTVTMSIKSPLHSHAIFEKTKKSTERIFSKLIKSEQFGDESMEGNVMHNRQFILCKLCQYPTELTNEGFEGLPQNYLIIRKIEEFHFEMSETVISCIWCSLCYDKTNATHHCLSCVLNLCTLCKESHERQRSTTNHKIENIMDLRRRRRQQRQQSEQNSSQQNSSKCMLKCSQHPEYIMKFFCINCLQVICSDCIKSLHKNHKHQSISHICQYYKGLLNESIEKMQLLCNYGPQTLAKFNVITKNINDKCDNIEKNIERHIQNYYEAVKVHRETLLQQIHRARKSKIDMILQQQMDLDKRIQNASMLIKFTQKLMEMATDVEILNLVKILMERFEYCHQYKMPVDPQISDSLQFLPYARAPSNKIQYDIPLFGLITMQIVNPSLCTLEWGDFTQLRLHKKVNLTVVSRDMDGMPLCHGGLAVKCQIQYKDIPTKCLAVEVQDNRDGTYTITFTPDSQGILLITIFINEKPLKGNPFNFLVRSVHAHTGIFHCCTFCSSRGNKVAKCACDGRMPGYKGCGHGHTGHPGKRHWSCCGNVLQDSECHYANKLLNLSN